MFNFIKYVLRRTLPDKLFIKLMFWGIMGYKLDLKNPKDYNEKLQWLKLYDRNPEYTKLVDKYEVREYIKETIGKDYLIPIYGVYKNFSEIVFEDLPKSFVIKATHTSGDVIIVKDKNKLNYKKLKRTIRKWLKSNHFYYSREWPYKDVKPRIIIEKLMVDKINDDLMDYKFLCFNGEPKYIEVMSDRFGEGGHKVNYFNLNWEKVDIKRKNRLSNNKNIKKPANLNRMIEISRVLSKNKRFSRIDLYNINGKIYFGEITFYPGGGHILFENNETSRHLGNLIDLNK